MAIFTRIGRLFRGWSSRAVGELEERNPELLMESARQEFRARMAQYTQALARMAGVAERLKVQLKNKSAKVQELERRIVANHAAGNLQLAGSLAREYQDVKVDLATESQVLGQTEEAYHANLQQAQFAQREFEEKIHRLERQISQIKVQEAQAEAAGALSNVAFQIGDLGDTMKSVEDILARRYELSAGKARLAKDMTDTQFVQQSEDERRALERVSLEEFLAEKGLAPPQEMPKKLSA